MRVMTTDMTAAEAVSIRTGIEKALPAWRSTSRPQGRGRIAPFQPEGKRLAVFYLHIPRCGGASVTRFLERVYGPAGVTCEAQARLDAIFDGQAKPVVTDCVVASLPLVRWLHFAGAGDYQRVTMLRNPWARLVSQINRLAEIGPEGAAVYGPSARTLAEEVVRADFTSRSGLDRFSNRLRLIDSGFDNLQVRMLVTGTMSALVKHITPKDVDVAFRELERFAVVGFCEEQLDLQRTIARLTGTKIAASAVFEGASKSSVLSVRNTLARDVLLPLYELDQELYARARALVAARQV